MKIAQRFIAGNKFITFSRPIGTVEDSPTLTNDVFFDVDPSQPSLCLYHMILTTGRRREEILFPPMNWWAIINMSLRDEKFLLWLSIFKPILEFCEALYFLG